VTEHGGNMNMGQYKNNKTIFR